MDSQLHNLPAPFQQEGLYRKIVPDQSFLLKMIKVGILNFERDVKVLVGPNAVIASSWCIDEDVIQHLAGIDELPREHLTCVDKESCDTDLDCISNLVGEFNSENLIVATQDHMQKYSRVARLPALTYNSSDVLVYWPPSPAQLDFASLPQEKRREKVLKEASKVYKKVKKLKQLKRKSWV